MRYPTRKDLDNVADVLSELTRRGVDPETVGRLQAVITAFEKAGQWDTLVVTAWFAGTYRLLFFVGHTLHKIDEI